MESAGSRIFIGRAERPACALVHRASPNSGASTNRQAVPICPWGAPLPRSHVPAPVAHSPPVPAQPWFPTHPSGESASCTRGPAGAGPSNGSPPVVRSVIGSRIRQGGFTRTLRALWGASKRNLAIPARTFAYTLLRSGRSARPRDCIAIARRLRARSGPRA